MTRLSSDSSSLPSIIRNFESASPPATDTTPPLSSFLPSDSGYIGLAVPEVKPDHVLRIYHCNPNGLRSTATDDDWCEFLQAMAAFSVDVICASEINVDSRQSTCLSVIHRHCRRTFDHYLLSIASSAVPALSSYKPGGVAMVTVQDAVGRIVDRGSDEMGRWCYQTLQGKNHRKVTVITAYQVCESTTPMNAHSLTACAQQASMLRIASRNISPRQAFIHDLTTFVQSIQQLDHGILLIGDFNAPLDTSYTNMSKLCNDCNLCDVLYTRTGRDNFKTWQRGSARRIDYALCTDWVAESVRSCCYEPFQFRTKGDHRNMVLDLDLHALLGNPNSHLASPASREFNSKDASSVATYIRQKHRYLTQHNFFRRLNAAHTQWSPDLAERLDRDFQRSSSFAARQCKRKPNVVFVQKLAALRREKNVLHRLVSQTRTGQSLHHALARLTAEGWSFDIPSTVEACQVRCRHLQSEIRSLHKQALTSRQQEQLTSLAQAEACGDAPRAKRLRHLIAAEKTKSMYQKLRRFRHSTSGGLTKLDVPASGYAGDPTSSTEWITIDTPLEIEQALRERNQRHFGQAEGTFPTVPPFSEWVNWTASTHVAELILEGQFNPSGDIDPLAAELLAHMQRRSSLDAIPATITADEWKDKIRAWPESTSTSPSGFHLTHSKALIARHNVALDTTEGLELEQMRDELLSAQVSLLNLALANQYSFERWKTVVNVMILKEPNNFRINKLRVIHLYEHDYNLLLAIKWRLLIQRATRQNLLHPGQFGGIPGRDAVIPTVIEELQYEISRASKRPLVHVDYDATACYDRIVIPFSSLIARGFGQHRSVVYIHASTLQEARYLLKTQLGVSDSFYKHCQLFPIHGSGQGAGNSPGLWCCISSVLFTAYDSSAHGAQFSSPDGQFTIHLFLIGFVDDTSCSVNDFYLPSPAPVTHYISRAQHDAQRWNDVLSLSGGALNPAKCSYHVLYYDFTPSGLPVLKGGTFPPALSIKFSRASSSQPLLQLPASSPHKTLGVYKSPSGSSTSGYQYLVRKATVHASTVSRNPLNKQDTWAYYHAIAIPSLLYPLPSMSLSPSQCEAIQKELKRAILPKCGYNRSTPNAVVFGHSDFGGLEFRTMYVEQGIAQLHSLLSCLRSTGVAHQLACIAITWGQHLAGTGVSLLEDVQTSLPHLDPMVWIPSIRSFLAFTHCHLEVSLPALIPPPQRLHDCHLMDIILSSAFSPSQIRLINCCRLYLGVRLLSDVTVHDGSSICPHVAAGRRPPGHFFKGLQPYQAPPGPTAWKLWRHALSLFTFRGSLQLRQPLGLWVVSGPALFREWVSYATYYPQRVYLRKQREYEIYNFTHGLTLTYTGTSVPILPTSAVPIAVDYGGSEIRALHYPTPPALSIPSSPPSSFTQFVESLPDWERVLLQHCTFLSDGVFDFVSQIKSATTCNSHSAVVAASDGSAPGFRGTYGWSCALSDGTRLAQNFGVSPGFRTSSFRAELYGLLSFLRFLIRTHEYTATALPLHIHLYTDSKSAVDRLSTLRQWPYFFPNMTLIPEWDLLQSIITACQQLGDSLRICHVLGHQDRHAEVCSLSLPAQLNVAADALATHAAFLHDGLPTTRAPMITGSMVLLHSPMGTVTSRLRPVLRRLATAQASKIYLCKSNQWSPSVFDLVDWSSHGLCIRRWYHRKVFITKFVNNWLPLGHHVSRYTPFYPASCPSCGYPDEDRTHFLSCPSRPWLDSLLQQLRIVQETTPTHPALFETLCLGLRHWNDPNLIPWPSFPSSVSRLVLHQSRVGWPQLLLGRFVCAWAEIHDQFVADGAPPSACRSGEQWVARVTTLIWDHVHNQWISRNEARHGRDAITREAALADQAGRELEYLYSLRLQVLPRDRRLFHASVAAHRSAMPSSSAMRQWILTWGPVIRQSALTCHSLHLQNTRPISSYFP